MNASQKASQHYRRSLWLLVSLLLIAATSGPAIAGPLLNLRARVELKHGMPGTVKGTIEIKDWAGEAERCLYLPVNDPKVLPGGVSVDYFRTRDLPIDRLSFSRGALSFASSAQEQLEIVRPELVKLKARSGDITLEFTTKLPRQHLGIRRDVFLDHFHPQLLARCPTAEETSSQFVMAADTRIKATIVPPSGWESVQPMPDGYETLQSPRLAVALLQGYKEQRRIINGVDTVIMYRSSKFLELTQTISSSLDSHREYFGAFPFPRLVIVESSELQRSDMPGIVPLNTPQQQVLSSLQSDLLNWTHWVTTKLLAYQWYGAYIRPARPEDAWLVMGISDFATLAALRKNPTRYDLFNIFDFERFMLSLNYLQAQEMASTLLVNARPELPLTDASGRSLGQAWEQHGYQFLRQAVAMRHLAYVAGEVPFQRFLRAFTEKHGGEPLTPEVFQSAINAVPSAFAPLKREELSRYLNKWWTTGGWPDYAFVGLDAKSLEDGRWLATVEFQQLGKIDFPVPIEIKDKEGKTYSVLSKPDDQAKHSTQIITDAEPDKVNIDPQNIFFDVNRYNNNNSWPDIRFFPGNAHTLANNAYTILWFPYPFRRPGEAAGIGVQFGILKYLDSGLLLSAETDFAMHDTGYSIERRDSFPKLRLSSKLTLTQNLAGRRLAKAGVSARAFELPGAEIRPNIELRHRSQRGSNGSALPSASTGFEMKTGEILGCSHRLLGDWERSLPDSPNTYTRLLGMTDTSCDVMAQFNLELRLFRGVLRGSELDPLPAYLGFEPENLSEARLRLDEKGLASSRDIGSVTTDVLFPLRLPLPGSLLILSNKVRGRAFYDFGRSYDLNKTYRAAGLGLLLPFGGELSGIGALALTRFSALAILYSAVDTDVNRVPRFVFDISSEL